MFAKRCLYSHTRIGPEASSQEQVRSGLGHVLRREDVVHDCMLHIFWREEVPHGFAGPVDNI